MTRTSRRTGLSLVEVLTALFIVALGVTAILTMFPLGASQMAIAVRENRSMEAAFSADAQMRSYWKHNVVEPQMQSPPGAPDPFFNALTDPNQGAGVGLTRPTLTPVLLDKVSYPVFLDPMGFVARGGASQYWIGDTGGANIPRRNLATIANSSTPIPLAQRWCSAMDNLGYSDDGVPQQDREMRYNWLWIIQRSNNANRLTANMTIVVFDRRAHLYTPPKSEDVFTGITFTPGTSSVSVPGSPDIRAGGWVMDATISTVPGGNIRHANFYRVSALNPDPNIPGNTILELQSPIKTPSDNGGAYTNGTLLVMRGVSGVYTRPPLTPGD